MILAMSTTVFASGNSATITVNGAGTDATIEYVQVIEPDTTTETGWKFSSDTIETAYITAFTEGTMVPTAQEVIKELIAYNAGTSTDSSATASNISEALDSILSDSDITKTTANANPFTVNAAGVYAIKATEAGYTYSSMAAYVSFDYADSSSLTLNDATVIAKRVPNAVEKTSEDTDKVVEVGREVEYSITTTVPYLTEPTGSTAFYQIKDELTGATYVTETSGTVKVTVTVGDTTKTGTFYVTPATSGSTQTFTLDLTAFLYYQDASGNTISFANTYANQALTITYSATVTDIQVGNTVRVGDGTSTGSAVYGSDTENLYTGLITLTKYNAETGASQETLSGAGFKIYKTETEGQTTTTYYAKFESVQSSVTIGGSTYSYYKFAGWTTDKAEATEVKTDNTGILNVGGLDAGTYYFTEVTAPEGYSINATDVSATLSLATGSTSATAILTNATSMTDTTLSSLPSTGGMGTMVFTVVGCAVIVFAAALFFATRRRNRA